jgi:hypothetical protein
MGAEEREQGGGEGEGEVVAGGAEAGGEDEEEEVGGGFGEEEGGRRGRGREGHFLASRSRFVFLRLVHVHGGGGGGREGGRGGGCRRFIGELGKDFQPEGSEGEVGGEVEFEGLGKGGGREGAAEGGVVAEDPVDETELGGLDGFFQEGDVLFEVWEEGEGGREGEVGGWGRIVVAVLNTMNALTEINVHKAGRNGVCWSLQKEGRGRGGEGGRGMTSRQRRQATSLLLVLLL